MRHVVLTLAVVLTVACRIVTPPEVPTGPGSCEDACENLKRLGCDLWGAECLPACERVWQANHAVDARTPTACLAAADSCAEAEACR